MCRGPAAGGAAQYAELRPRGISVLYGFVAGMFPAAPGGGRGAELALERAAERRLRVVAAALRDADDRVAAGAQALRRERQAPARQVLHRRFADQAGKA